MQQARNRIWGANNNRLQQMNELQSDELVRVEPENVIVFYRNQFESASSIKITKSAALKQTVKFRLKTTNKAAYFVSESSGEITNQQVYRYINILINEQVPLEQCLHDRFMLQIQIPRSPKIEKKFKVIIDYKKELTKSVNKDMQRLEVVSKTSGHITANPSIHANPIAAAKKSMLKKSQLAHAQTPTPHTEHSHIKEDLEEVVKKIAERRARLDYLEKEIQKNKSRQRFMWYIAILVMALALLLGMFIRKSVMAGIKYVSALDY